MDKFFSKKIYKFVLMLIVILTVFCIPSKNVKAGDLTSLEVIRYEKSLSPSFSPDVYNYSIKIPSNELDLFFNYEKENESDKVVITGNRYLKNLSGNIVIKVGSDKEYTISYSREDLELHYDYQCTKNIQYFEIPITGRYVLETWGAQGSGYDLSGNVYSSYGGKGGYSKGVISLSTSDILHIYVGCVGTYSGSGIAYGGWNGGGAAYTSQNEDPANGGGGASDIRVNSDSLYSRVIVAGGGGGGSEDYPDSSYSSEISGGAGGGEKGLGNTAGNNYGGTQTGSSGGGTFGYGANTPNDGGGGGGGWYGGGTANGSQNIPTGNNNADTNGGSGGSGFVLNEKTVLNVPSGYLLDEKYYLKDSLTIDGENSFLSPSGENVTGNKGDGYIRISPYDDDFKMDKDNYLVSLIPSVGTMSVPFEITNEKYTVTTSPFDQYISFETVTSSDSAFVFKDDSYLLDKAETVIDIFVTAENGETRIYTITVVRPELEESSHSSKIKTITYFDGQKIYPSVNDTEYTIRIPNYKSVISIVPEFYDPEATYEISGNELLSGSGGDITIVVSEPHVERTTYILHYTRFDVQETNNFECTNSTQTYTTPVKGIYKLEVWGSQGSGSNSNTVGDVGPGGKGGYSVGEISLDVNEKLFVEVGCYGTVTVTGLAEGGYNGGGAAFSDKSNDPAAGGGGGTDIRIGENSLFSRVIVAGGGGGGSEDASEIAGAGGGLTGTGNSKGNNYPGTQTGSSGGGIFGYGANTANDGGGGGGGWYGGGTVNGNQTIPTSNTDSDTNGGSGGSGFVFNEDTQNNTPVGYLLDSKYYLSNSETIAGTENMPSPLSTGTTVGHEGEGYARITFVTPKSDDYFMLNLTSDVGQWRTSFDPLIFNYIIDVDMYTQKILISGEKNNPYSTVVGLGEYYLDIGDNVIDVLVTAQDGSTKLYSLTVKRKDLEENHTAEINKILIDGYADIVFEKDVLEYNISILPSEAHLEMTIIPYDSEETYEVFGNVILDDIGGTIIIVSNEPHSESVTYTITYSKEILDYGSEYTCINDVQTYTAPATGTYKLQVWGAQGGYRSYASNGGKGGYSEGTIELQEGETLYVYVGGSGNTGGTTGGFNGGGSRASYNGGGGATDIRVEGDSLYNRIIVAGGGGSDGAYNKPGKAGGGTEGISATESYGSGGSGGTQTYAGDGGDFGQGGYGSYDNGGYGGAGGGGWYGGGGSTPDGSGDDDRGGGGGSGFVYTNTGSTPVDGYLVQNHVLTEAKTVDGTNENIPTYDGTSTMTGNSGNGYAKINITDVLSKDFYLLSLMTDKGEWNKSFEPLTNEYNITLGVDDTQLTVSGRPSSDLASIDGLGEYDIPAGTTTIEITVTAESGDERVYKLNVTREASPESRAKDIIITGLVDRVCEGHDGYCVISPEFNEDTGEYTLTVPAGIRDLEFTVIKKHFYEEVVGDGVTKLLPGENTVSIEITSEDGLHQSLYTYDINRDISDDNYIDKLKVRPIDEENNIGDEIDIGFNYLLEEYSIKVENNITSLDLEIELDAKESANVKEIRGLEENLKVGSNIVEIDVEAPNKEIRTYTLNVYRVSNNNPLLESLNVRRENEYFTLSPEFRDVQSKYTVVVENEVTSVTIDGTTQKETTTVDGFGEKTLNVGNNKYSITTTAENGMTFVYEITITRKKSSNNYLSTLEIEEGSLDPVFDKEEPEYRVTVEPHTKKLTITAFPEVETSNVQIIGNNDFSQGENIVTIRVTAEDNSTNDYTIIVTKEVSSNNYLSELYVGNIEYEFDKENPDYEFNVLNEVKKIEIEGIAEDTLSRVDGNREYNLVSGENNITITVTAEDNSTREYHIKITREYNHNANLKEINISKGTLVPGFGVEETEYSVEIENSDESITIEGVPEVVETTVSGNDTYYLNSGETKLIELVTLAEDNETSITYKIRVTRKKNENAYLKSLSVEGGIMHDNFEKEVYEYTMKVRNNIDHITLDYELDAETSSAVVTNPETLIVGENEITILVTSEKGNTNLYKIKVTRLSEEDSKLNLKELGITSCTIDFNEDVYEYECEVEYEIEEVTISGEAKEEEYVVEGFGEKELNVGENEFEIKVYDEKKENNNVYSVKVKRKESAETRLRVINVDKHTFNEIYSPEESNYTLTTKENNIKITYEKMHEGQEVSISGNKGLTLGENTIIVHVLAANKVDSKDYIITVTKEKNENAYLKSLEVEGYSISPGFNKGTYEYTLEVENEIDEVRIIAEAEEITSTVSETGMHTIEKGLNEITLVVTAEDESTKEYTVKITRIGSRNNYLKSLEAEGHSINPEFDKEEPEYTLNVAYEIDRVNIVAEAEDSNAFVTGDGEFILEVGENIRNIIVTAEHGETKTYKVKVTRETPITSLLKEIKVRNYKLSPIFESTETNYTVVVDNEVESLELIIEKIDPASTYVIENNTLNVGENEVRVVSTSRDGNYTTTYTINVIRQSYSNTYLSSLIVSEGSLSPTFDKTTISYEVEVPYETETITVTGEPEIETSVVSGNGEYNLRVGNNSIEIKVTSEGNITRTYTINVKRLKSNNAKIIRITSDLGEVTKIDEETYSLLVPYDTIEILSRNITVEPEDANAVVSKQSKIDLNEIKIYKVRVTSEDTLVTKEYVINIELDKCTNAYLKSLSTSLGEISGFEKEVYEYTLNVDESDEEIEVFAEVDDARSTIINESMIFELDENTKEILITVQAEKGNTNIYKITVIKSKTHNKNLKNIEVTGIVEKCFECEIPTYYETKYNYEIRVPYEVDEIGFEVEKNHEGQSYKIYKDGIEVNRYTLDVGENNFVVRGINSYNEYVEYNYKIIREESRNNYLASLRLTSPEIEIEEFDKEVKEYYVEVDNSYRDIEVEAIAEDTLNARVRISGTTYLIEGMSNDVRIKVTSASRETREYVIHVLRKPESNNLLKTLTISSGDIYELTPKFNSGVTDYTLEVASVINSVQVEAVADDENAIITGTGEYPLKVGLNKVEVKVESTEGDIRTYTVNIVRSSARNVFLESLIIRNGSISPAFEKTKGIYTVNVAYTENALNIAYVPEDPGAKVEVKGNSNLEYGENIVYVKVTSSDGQASKTYTLTVIKGGEPNNNLLNIKVNGENIPGFMPEITTYNLTYDNIESSALVEVEKESELSRVRGIGNHALEEGKTNKIEITVTAQNGEIKVYEINIYRKKNNYLKDIIVDKGEKSPEFSKSINEYTVEVENEEKKITVIGVKEAEEAVVTGNGTYNLNIGENIITLRVENEEERIYTVKVIRKASDNNYLRYLSISGSVSSPDFSKEISEYTVKIPNTKESLELEYAAEDEEAITEVIGNSGFSSETEEVIIRVTSTSGKTREYILHVERLDESYFSSKLDELIIDKGSLSPRFDKDTYKYTVTLEGSSSIRITGVPEQESAVVTGDGLKTLKVGRNEFKIEVEGVLGEKSVYTVIVYRRSTNDARLEELEIANGEISPAFNKNVYDYVLSISNDEMYVDITKIVPVSEDATYEILDSEILYENIENRIRIKVTAGDNITTKTYTLNIVKTKSHNNYLRSLSTSVGNLKPVFDRETLVYTVNVDDSVNSINVEGVPESNLASVSGIGLYNLRKGNNYARIIVTAEDGNIRTYIVKIVKGASNNNYLKRLEVRNYEISPAFDKNEPNYTLEVSNDEEEVQIIAEAEDIKAEVTGDGVKALKVGENEYVITVTAENNEEREYTIKITRSTNIGAKIKELWVEEGNISPVFSPDIKEYTLMLPSEYTSITEHVELYDEEGSYELKGANNLKVGNNVVEIEVTSRSNEKETYIINVIRQSYSNTYLKKLEPSVGSLSPTFDKETLNYEVTVGSEISSISFEAEAEDEEAVVYKEEIYNIEKGKNKIVIKVESPSKIVREYKITVTRERSNNNYLESLMVNGYNISPAFDKNEPNYEMTTEIGEEEIEVVAEAEDTNASISGDGIYSISLGEKEIDIIVTAENGETRVYTLTVTREADRNLNIESITPSEGTLSPSFENTKEEYILNVGPDAAYLSIEVEPESNLTKVTGNTDIEVENNKKVTITLTAESGDTREIKITIKKEEEYTNIEVDNSINLLKGEEKAIVIKNNVPEENLIITVENEEVVTNSGLTLTGIEKGQTKVTIKLKNKESVEKKVIVNVYSDKLESNEYIIEEKEKAKVSIYKDPTPRTTISDYISGYTNERNMVKVYTKEGELVEDYTEIIKTGMKVKLEYGNVVYDEVKVIVLGDIDENGLINVTDQTILQNHIVGISTLDDYRVYAMDLSLDDKVNVTDQVEHINYLISH